MTNHNRTTLYLKLSAFFEFRGALEGLEYLLADGVDDWLRNGFRANMMYFAAAHKFAPIIDIADAIASFSTLAESQS